MKKIKWLCLFLFLVYLPVTVTCQQSGKSEDSALDSTLTSKIFDLGEITIVANRKSELSTRITARQMESENRWEVSRAANMVAGVSLTAMGPRNESMVTVRGFDLRQVPVYMDGIPVYVPFDGYVDLARFTTFDLAAIDISKGYSSILYGPNSLGGAINLVSRKPTEPFEIEGAVGMINTNGYRGNVNVGGRFGKFYLQGGLSYLHRDAFRMSSRFVPTPTEDGKQRDNAYRTDQKYNLKLGFTPDEKSEYVLGYIHQLGEKGQPVYAGQDTLNPLFSKPRYWQWPDWNKETFYFFSRNNIGSNSYVKSRIYYDRFINSIISYDDDTYTTITKPSAFKSWYNDYTYGGNAEFGTTRFKNHQLKFAAHFKRDVHREHDLEQPVLHFVDHTVSFGLEDVYNISDKWVIIPGIGYNTRDNKRAEQYDSSDETIASFPEAGASGALDGQMGLFYYVKEDHKLGAVLSRKTRFATIKDRYSYRLGTAIPNPGLEPETANNFELNYSGRFARKVSLETAAFYSRVTDIIMSIDNVQPGKSQMLNAGKAEYSGVEITVGYQILRSLLANVSYTYIERQNLTNPELYFTDVPRSKLIGYIRYQPDGKTEITLSPEYNSSRYSTSYGTKTGGFMLTDILGSRKIGSHVVVEGGVKNVFDKNYSLVEGFPEEGRNFFVTLRFYAR